MGSTIDRPSVAARTLENRLAREAAAASSRAERHRSVLATETNGAARAYSQRRANEEDEESRRLGELGRRAQECAERSLRLESLAGVATELGATDVAQALDELEKRAGAAPAPPIDRSADERDSTITAAKIADDAAKRRAAELLS